VRIPVPEVRIPHTKGVSTHQTYNEMYLAFILGLCALAIPSAAAIAVPAKFLQLSQQGQPPSEAPHSSSPSGAPQDAPVATPQTPQAEPEKTAPAQTSPEAQPKVEKKQESKPGAQTRPPVKHHRRKRSATNSTPSTPEKKVIRNGGTADPAIQLAPGVSDEQASRQRQSTTILLATTDTNLKQISARQLSASQQESVSQIRKYMEQAKTAEAAGDVQRAQNLASKALLLSDDLVKH
jgi:hypothetical protein